jgi:hypothetical protein
MTSMTALQTTPEHIIISKAKHGLQLVASGELTVMEGWLMYGAALNEGRELFPRGANARFSEWLSTNNLMVANDMERLAAMWAAGNPEEYRETRKDHPRVRTVRGLHAKFKEPSGATKVNPVFTDDDASYASKLQSLATQGATEGERENAQVRLDAFAGNFSMSTDEVVEKSKAQAEPLEPSSTTMQRVRQTLVNRGPSWLVEQLVDAMIRDHKTFTSVMEGLKK